MQFSSFDIDNDKKLGNCAAEHSGGWWFNNCHGAYLNGLWLSKTWHEPWFRQYLTGEAVNGTSMLIK